MHTSDKKVSQNISQGTPLTTNTYLKLYQDSLLKIIPLLMTPWDYDERFESRVISAEREAMRIIEVIYGDTWASIKPGNS